MQPTRPSPLWELDGSIQVGPAALGWNFLWRWRLVIEHPGPSVGHGVPTFQGGITGCYQVLQLPCPEGGSIWWNLGSRVKKHVWATVIPGAEDSVEPWEHRGGTPVWACHSSISPSAMRVFAACPKGSL